MLRTTPHVALASPPAALHVALACNAKGALRRRMRIVRHDVHRILRVREELATQGARVRGVAGPLVFSKRGGDLTENSRCVCRREILTRKLIGQQEVLLNLDGLHIRTKCIAPVAARVSALRRVAAVADHDARASDHDSGDEACSVRTEDSTSARAAEGKGLLATPISAITPISTVSGCGLSVDSDDDTVASGKSTALSAFCSIKMVCSCQPDQSSSPTSVTSCFSDCTHAQQQSSSTPDPSKIKTRVQLMCQSENDTASSPKTQSRSPMSCAGGSESPTLPSAVMGARGAFSRRVFRSQSNQRML